MGNLLGKLSCNVEIMRSPADRSTAVRPDGLSGMFASLDHEWRTLSRRGSLQARCQAWAAAEPALQGCANAHGIVSLVTWDGFQPAGAGNSVLTALLRQAVDSLAARAFLQAMLPRLRAERVLIPRYGHGVGDSRTRPADTLADLVAECYSAIRRHAGEDRDDVPRVVLQEATRRLRTARQAQRRYQARTVLLGPGNVGDLTAADLSVARSGAEWLTTALMDAVRSRRLSTFEASLVYGTRVKGLSASEVGRRSGLRPKAVYYALAQAERAFLMGTA